MYNLDALIHELVDYAQAVRLIEKEDEAYTVSRLMELFEISSIGEKCNTGTAIRPVGEILDDLCGAAADRGIIDGESIVARDLFDGKINAIASIGEGLVEMHGLINMIDNVNRILDRVALYLA